MTELEVCMKRVGKNWREIGLVLTLEDALGVLVVEGVTSQSLLEDWNSERKENNEDVVKEGCVITSVNGESRSSDLMVAKLRSIGLGGEIRLKVVSGLQNVNTRGIDKELLKPSQAPQKSTVHPTLKRHLKTLGLEENASPTEIRKRYIQLARDYHPDKNLEDNGEAKNKFQEINEAWVELAPMYGLKK
jgi:DnaJ-domain-containing protein 1